MMAKNKMLLSPIFSFPRISLSILVVTSALFIQACSSDSSSESASQKEVVRPVLYPFESGGALYEVDPETGLINQLTDPDAPNLTQFLDIITVASATQSSTYFPDYFIHSSQHVISLYELRTRRDHTLYTFPETEFICEIKPLEILDQDVLNKDGLVEIKDHESLLVSTSDTLSCPGDASKNFYQVLIENSFTEDFDIIAEIIDEKTLNDLSESADCEEVDQTITIPGNRTYTVKAIDGLGITNSLGETLTSCEKLLEPSVEQENQTHTVLVGKPIPIDEALFSTQGIVIDEENKQFGHLGYSDQSNALSFYLADKEDGTLDDIPLWSLDLEEFMWDGNKLPPRLTLTNHNYNLQTGFAILEHGWKTHFLSYNSLFDDDELTARLLSISNPLFERAALPVDEPYSYNFNRSSLSQSGNMVFRDGNELHFQDYQNDETSPSFSRSINTSDGSEFRALMHTSIMTPKTSISQETSLLSVSSRTGFETTVIPATSRLEVDTIFGDDLFVNFVEQDLTDYTFKSQLYDAAFLPYFDDFVDSSIVRPLIDPTEPDPRYVILKGAADSEGRLVNNTLFYLDTDQKVDELVSTDADLDGKTGERVGEGEFIGLLEDPVAEIIHAEILSDDHGILKVRPFANDDQYRVYYFNPSTSYGEDFEPLSLILLYDSDVPL